MIYYGNDDFIFRKAEKDINGSVDCELFIEKHRGVS